VSVVLCKWHLKNVNAIADLAFFYPWTARLLIERLSWFGKKHGKVSLVLAQVKGHPHPSAGLSEEARSDADEHRVAPPQPAAGVGTPKVRRLLQLADAASGAVFAAFERCHRFRRLTVDPRPQLRAYPEPTTVAGAPG